MALIAAEDLKWLAEKGSAGPGGRFDLQVLNYTGVLGRQVLQGRLKLFGG